MGPLIQLWLLQTLGRGYLIATCRNIVPILINHLPWALSRLHVIGRMFLLYIYNSRPSLRVCAISLTTQGTKVNSNPKGVSAPTLAPANDATEASAKVLADATLKEAATMTGDVNTAAAAASGKASEEEPDTPAATTIGRKEKEAAGEVESLCTAVRQAWTDDVGAAGDGHGPAAENENDEDKGESEGSDSGSASNGDGEEEGEEDGDDVGDDDEWEPEGDGAEKANSGDAATAASAPFSADDFPSLGGGKSVPVPAAAPAAAAASTSSPSLPPAATAAKATAPADAPTSSWSLMARSNPAPFKVPAKADPAPLPAAAAPPLTTDDDPAGHFATSGVASLDATAAAARPRPDGAKPGTSRIMSTAAAFGVSGGGADDDDGEGWVNPSNIKSQKAAGIGLNGPSQTQRKGSHKGRSTVASRCRAGCVTTDFAMQNVILQVRRVFVGSRALFPVFFVYFGRCHVVLCHPRPFFVMGWRGRRELDSEERRLLLIVVRDVLLCRTRLCEGLFQDTAVHCRLRKKASTFTVIAEVYRASFSLNRSRVGLKPA